MTELSLSVEGFSWPDLHDPERLAALDRIFDSWLAEQDADASAALRRLRSTTLSPREHSAVLVQLAPFVGRFVARLFGVEAEVEAIARGLRAEESVFAFKKHVVRKRVLDRAAAEKAWGRAPQLAHRVVEHASATLAGVSDDEEARIAGAALRVHELNETARKAARGGGAQWTDALRAEARRLRAALSRDDEIAHTLAVAPTGDDADDARLLGLVLDAFACSLAVRRADPGDPVSSWATMQVRHELHYDQLVQLRTPSDARTAGETEGPREKRREREEPFALTDGRMSPRAIANEVDLCLDCHEREKDSCSKGLFDKKKGDEPALKKNPLGVALAGCPLGEPIGEMNALRRGGEVIGALAVVTVANPMCPGTGHRICNDCMKACVFQIQEPVNIPEIETRVLSDVLSLPWGFEIWSLLARWNPLRPERPVPRPYIGKNVLVVGLGPAGYTLCHHLLDEGLGVVAIDGLKIEPLDRRWLEHPIRDVREIQEPLDRRTIGGFGGVSEYGITVRWDKSFLALLHLSLARRAHFRAFGGVRFGGTIRVEDAWELGFDHIAIAAGAGKPTLIDVPNGLARGVRQASDFLMALQLTGAFRRDSLANLEVRLPAVVIGGGLTAIDTATEARAYYVVQVERTLARVEALGIDRALEPLDEEERQVVLEQVAHARAIRAEREAAQNEKRAARINDLIDGWGGVRVVYRRRLVDSPAYRLNHEEVAKSLEEGVRYVELHSPLEVHVDRFGAAEAITLEVLEPTDGGGIRSTGARVRLPARTILVAAGTRPNVTYEREHRDTFELDPKSGYFASHDARVDAGGNVELVRGEGFFTSYLRDGRTVSYYGDNHPRYAGSVVKAMASAKDGHPHVVRLFGRAIAAIESEEGERREQGRASRERAWRSFADRLEDQLIATVHEVKELAPGIVEVVCRAPLAAARFSPGQFYRLQTYETGARRHVWGGELPTTLSTEGIALTGAWTDPERGLVSLIVLELGASSRLCRGLAPGQPVIVMGPTGAPTEIGRGEKVVLIGGGLGNAVLFSIGRAMRAAGSRVLYFAGYRRGELLFKEDEIEESSDQIVWATDAGAVIAPRRPQDRHVRGNMIEAMLAYERGELGDRIFSLAEADRVLTIGSDGLMKAIARARRGELGGTLLSSTLGRAKAALASVNSPMQCMMKEICGQCLQRHVDPGTGKERYVYTCFEQDQPLDQVDFEFLRQRLRQCSAQEKISDAWLTAVLGAASESIEEAAE